jgi:hypothetical protein
MMKIKRMQWLIRFLFYTLVMGAVSSCTVGCGSLQSVGAVQPVNSNQVAANRQLPPADPNQALLQVLQQKSFENAVRKMLAPDINDQQKCKPVTRIIEKQQSLTCADIEKLFFGQCNGDSAKVSDFDFQG